MPFSCPGAHTRGLKLRKDKDCTRHSDWRLVVCIFHFLLALDNQAPPIEIHVEFIRAGYQTSRSTTVLRKATITCSAGAKKVVVVRLLIRTWERVLHVYALTHTIE
eukprot:4339137-Pyramimonas_sp.AAC.2